MKDFKKMKDQVDELQAVRDELKKSEREINRSVLFLQQSDKRKQLLKITFLVNEQIVSVMYIDINAILLCLDLRIFQQDECFCSKLGMEVEYMPSPI